ncbi:MAG TPA: hypothetical protein VLB85_08675 [Acidimicrobiia bacterium]|nr:hypothetical protein [Acidimicrobiia bacterium]
MTTLNSSRIRMLVTVLLLALVLAACAAGSNPEVGNAAPDADTAAGFWLGLWHGIIAPVTFVISLFTDNVNLYEVHNSGNWYDFGFVLGAGILFGGGSAGSRRSR